MNKNTEKKCVYNEITYFKYVDLETLDKIMKYKTIRMSSHDSFNDPFDCHYPGYFDTVNPFSLMKPLLYKAIPGLQEDDFNNEELKEMLTHLEQQNEFKEIVVSSLEDIRKSWDNYLSDYRVLCLTKERDNILLWSHYADNHSGAVLCFDFHSDDFFSDIKK
ncbi:hypothetical protein PEC301653_18710 [Pectobacterium carotovorum subsp. carotovorum]|uniref:hypothetical protein n=1 Tax=Pectobacterium sp. CHL-2024 TaxID=3377079 RepID=UPI00208C7B2E|nr:hypothetical protein PEC301653_18710 [Pectobacterium carotovorum subsp. carotovorum]